VQVNGPPRIRASSFQAARDGATSGLLNSEPAKVWASLPGNAVPCPAPHTQDREVTLEF
jgi:hypothetical protein